MNDLNDKSKHIVFPAIANTGIPVEQAMELAQGLTVLFSGVPKATALSIMLTTTLRVAAEMLPRSTLDGIVDYETSQVYGPHPKKPSVLPNRPQRRRMR